MAYGTPTLSSQSGEIPQSGTYLLLLLVLVSIEEKSWGIGQNPPNPRVDPPIGEIPQSRT